MPGAAAIFRRFSFRAIDDVSLLSFAIFSGLLMPAM